MLKLLLLRACNDILGHNEEKYALPGLHVDFAITEKPAQPSGLFARNEAHGMLEDQNYYAVDMDFLLLTSCIDESLGFDRRCELTRMEV